MARRRGRESFLYQVELGMKDDFYTKLADPGSDHLNVKLIGQDLNFIQKKAQIVERFATKRLAHYDKIPPLKVRYAEIDAALDALDVVMGKYSKLFSLGWRAKVEFESLFPDWPMIFETAWIDEPGGSRR
jgi:hypothetical protein